MENDAIKNCRALITRLPYAPRYSTQPIIEMSNRVDARSLICISIPIHIEHPNNGGRLIYELEQSGLILVAKCVWYRDRHIVTTKSKRLTNTWEPVAIFSRQKNYHINREAATKIKKGFETKEMAFDEEEFQTCIGDHWAVRNDRRDRRFLPSGVVLNCAQLADLQAGDSILDPYGNPGIKDACNLLGWKYVDGGLPNSARNSKKDGKDDENEELLCDGKYEEESA